MEPQTAVTTSQMWTATLVAAVVALVLGLVAHLLVRRPGPRLLPRFLLGIGALWFGALYAWAAWTFWDTCYGAVLPPWARTVAPFVGVAYGCLGWVFWWVARRIVPAHPVPAFLLLGGLLSLPGHLFGIYGRGLLEGCSVVRGVSPASALTFGLFEFATYWGLILVAATLASRLASRLAAVRRPA